MTHESPAPGRASADAQDVMSKRTAEERHGGEITAKQRRRWSPLTVNGILARPTSTAQAHDLAMALGKVMRRDGTFDDLRNDEDGICVEIRASHRDKVLRELELSSWSWEDYVRQWKAAGLAHRCSDLKRGCVRLLLQPADVCPIPSCGETLLGATVERGSQQRSTLPTATEIVLTAGDASGDEEGDVPSKHSTDGDGPGVVDSDSFEQHSEIAAFAALKRADVRIGDPMTDAGVRALGYRPTRRGWVPIEEAG